MMVAREEVTPLPWRVGRSVHGAVRVEGEDGDKQPIADCYQGVGMREIDEAHARAIVRAVNCHDDLVAALRDLIAENEPFDLSGSWLAAMMNAKAALAKATGGGE